MKKHFHSITALLCVAGLCLSLCTACSGSGKEAKALDSYVKEKVKYTALLETGSKVPAAEDVVDKKKAQENEYLILYYEDKLASVSLFDKRTGEWWHSNPATGNLSAAAKSQLTVSTISSQGIIQQYTSYTDSVLRNQVEYKVKNGLTVTYTFGNIKPDLSDVPVQFTEARYQELAARAEAAGQTKSLLTRRYMKREGVYIRKENITADQAEKLRALFEAIGYTAEELAADHAENGVTVLKEDVSGFMIPLQYTLEGDSLLVNIAGDGIRYPTSDLITSLNVLGYFGALTEGEKGYMLLPDGSGARMDTTPQKGNSGYYRAALYGTDYTLPREAKNSESNDILLPVFGVSRPHSGVLTVIEDNEGTAFVKAVKPGYVDTFATVSADFELNATENIGLSSDSISKFYVTAETRYQGDTTLRYIFLTEEKADYVGMANTYRAYLEQVAPRKLMAKKGDIPFFLETIGAVKTEVSTLGIVHETFVPLTSFEDNIALMEELSEKGVGNVQLILSGWMNGGMDPLLANKADPMGALGGSGSFKKLLDYAAENGAKVYPAVQLNTFSQNEDLLTKNQYSSQTLASEKSVKSRFSIVTGMPLTGEGSGTRNVLSPTRQREISDLFLKALKATGATGVNLSDIAHTAYGDFNESNEALRQTALLQSAEITNLFRDELDGLLLTAPNNLTANAADLFTDVPKSSSSYSLMAQSIPFYQMVYHGYADYSFEAMNFDSDFRQSLLKCAEYGGCPKFKFTYREDERLSFVEYSDYSAARYIRWMDGAAEAYAFLNELLQPVRNARMVGHETLSDGVTRTDYDNGVSVYVNYTATDVTVDGITVEAQSAARKEGAVS